MLPARFRNLGLFVLVSVLFGSVFVGIKAGQTALPPVFFGALRFDIAAPLLLGYAAWRSRTWLPRTRADFASVAVSAVTIIAANNALLFVGQQTTTPAVAAVMYGLNPILAPVFAFLLLGERLDVRGAVGILLGLVGVVIIVQPSPATFTSGSTIGELMVLGAAAAFALGSVSIERFDADMESIPLTAWAMVGGAALLHLLSVGLGESLAGTVLTPTVIAAVLVVGLASTAVAYPAYFALIPRIGPVRTNLVAYVAPVVAAITGWVLLDEPVTLATVAGFFVIVAGVALLERRVLVAEYERFARRRAGAESE
ncbi:MAG: DMT family transporter [Haloarculaceae archaeon]